MDSDLNNWVFMFINMMVVVVVMVMVRVVVSSVFKQRLSFLVRSNGLSDEENSLLYEKNQEESKADDELRDRELHIYVVFCLYLCQNLNQN